jgi:hypothetical protein
MSPTIPRAELARLAKNAGPDSPLHALVKSTRPKREKRTPAKDLPPSQGRTLRIVVPMPSNLTNPKARSSRHYFAANRRRKQFVKMLDELATAGLIPPPPAGGFGRVSVTSVMYVGGTMDDDNAIARHKPLLDWLQRNGYLVNDRYAKWSALPTQVVKPGQDYRIELTLTEP